MTRIYDCTVGTQLMTGMRLARAAIGRGELAVIPTDTVYGVAADAFSPEAVQRLFDAKGRDRSSPAAVLIPGAPTLDALAATVPDAVRDLVAEFWPGGLTVILRAQSSLTWDLGDARGSVALRMPSNPIVLELLAETGPLAVSSANTSGQPAATNVLAAFEMLGEGVSVYLDGGEVGDDYEAIGDRPDDLSSTIVDASKLGTPDGRLTIVRNGVVSRERIEAIVGDLLAPAAAPDPQRDPEPVLESHPNADTDPPDRGVDS